MAITAGVTVQYKKDCHNGVHQPGNTYKIAFYTSAATIGPTTAAYTATGEATGTNVPAGGVTLAGRAVTVNGTSVDLDFTDPAIASATLTARGAMIYNASATGTGAIANPSIVVLDFGADVSSTGATFTVDLTPPTVRIS